MNTRPPLSRRARASISAWATDLAARRSLRPSAVGRLEQHELVDALGERRSEQHRDRWRRASGRAMCTRGHWSSSATSSKSPDVLPEVVRGVDGARTARSRGPRDRVRRSRNPARAARATRSCRRYRASRARREWGACRRSPKPRPRASRPGRSKRTLGAARRSAERSGIVLLLLVVLLERRADEPKRWLMNSCKRSCCS